MMPPPNSFAELLQQVDQVREDVSFIRAMRNLRVPISSSREVALQYAPGSDNAVVDLRGITPTAVAEPDQLPSLVSHGGQYLATDGATAFWVALPTFNTWRARVIAAGGTFTSKSEPLAAKLALAISQSTFASKIVHLMPLLGGNLAAARVPLIDALNVGIATNTGFVEADFTEASGLQGANTGKYLDSLIKPSQLGATNNGGLGWWERSFTSFAGSHVAPIGIDKADNSPDCRFNLDLRTSGVSFNWSTSGNQASQAVAATNTHYYGQRNGASDRRLFVAGVQVNQNTTADATAGSGDNTLLLSASNDGNTVGIRPWPGRCGVVYMTDGTLTTTETAALHSILQNCIITPTGR